MLEKSTLKFLKALKKNNNRDWFKANKGQYDNAKANFNEFTQALINAIAQFDTGLNNVEAKTCLFRIYRDVRFSKDKSPYKPNMGASIAPGGRKSTLPCYYLHVEPGNSFLAGGLYHPEAHLLHKVRQEIDYNEDEFRNILAHKTFNNYFGELWDGDRLKTAPQNYPKDHSAIDLLRNKSFIVSHYIDDKQLLASDAVESCKKVYKAMYPMNQFLKRSFDD